MAKRLRISRTPSGAAPEHVRRALVGLELPLREAGEFALVSVLEARGPSSRVEAWWWRLTGRVKRSRGFSVPVLDALAVLEAARPLEAAWWRQNAPHLCLPLKHFVFDASCGEVVE